MSFQIVFDRLRALYAPFAADGVVVRDVPGEYAIGTLEVRKRDGYRTAFGAVEIRKAYVSAHLMPVYVHPALLADISPQLRRRMQGKACFNFRAVDEAVFTELAALIKAGAAQFAADGRMGGRNHETAAPS